MTIGSSVGSIRGGNMNSVVRALTLIEQELRRLDQIVSSLETSVSTSTAVGSLQVFVQGSEPAGTQGTPALWFDTTSGETQPLRFWLPQPNGTWSWFYSGIQVYNP